jgi:hypothetical protein
MTPKISLTKPPFFRKIRIFPLFSQKNPLFLFPFSLFPFSLFPFYLFLFSFSHINLFLGNPENLEIPKSPKSRNPEIPEIPKSPKSRNSRTPEIRKSGRNSGRESGRNPGEKSGRNLGEIPGPKSGNSGEKIREKSGKFRKIPREFFLLRNVFFGVLLAEVPFFGSKTFNEFGGNWEKSGKNREISGGRPNPHLGKNGPKIGKFGSRNRKFGSENPKSTSEIAFFIPP